MVNIFLLFLIRYIFFPNVKVSNFKQISRISPAATRGVPSSYIRDSISRVRACADFLENRSSRL
jgi:hypothetical protein